MQIDGEVTTGLGKAAFFLSQEFYTNEFKKNLGFVPYPGTLNVVVSEEYLDEINEKKDSCSCPCCYDACVCASFRRFCSK